jgi:hypothetical protein
MATIILDFDDRNVQAKKALDFIPSMGLFKLRPAAKEKTGLELAFEDIKKGRITKIDNPDELYEECLK